MFVSGKVTTNLDEYMNEKWPSVFAEVPKIGSGIESLSGIVLKVVGIIHSHQLTALNAQIPYIEIEVNGG
jgi:hypothetical protein